MFWEGICKESICRALLKGQDNPMGIKPNYTNWSPYICPTNCRNAINTGYLKSPGCVRDDDFDLENIKDFPVVSGDNLLEILKEKSKNKNQLLRICKDLGVNASKKSMTDLCVEIMNILKHQSIYKKAFQSIYQHSGGYYLLLCKHRVVYGMKCILRREGPRDGGDMLLSLRVPPTAWFSDNANLFAKHVNKRSPDHFSPNQGRICAESDVNIAAAKAGSLSVPMPHLDARCTEFKPPDIKLLKDGIHPVTKVADRFCFSDEFHKRNLCDEQDRLLRSFKYVPELNASLSTVGHEQLFAKFDKNKHFLNKFHSSAHMLLMRLIFNDHNDKANRDIFEKMDSRIKITTTLDGHKDYIRSFGFASEDPIVLSDSNESTNNDTDMEEFSSEQPVFQAEMTSSMEDSQNSVSDKTLSEDKDDEMHIDTEGDFVTSDVVDPAEDAILASAMADENANSKF